MKWISVNDKLPTTVLVVDQYAEYKTSEDFLVLCTDMSYKIARYEIDSNRTYWVTDDGSSISVTHWMKLPELPYEE